MNEFIWKQLEVVTDELNRLQSFKADCIKRGQWGADVDGQISELHVRRAQLSRILGSSAAQDSNTGADVAQ